ncbi:MAG: hypothetical protein M3X11_02040, partial [Acidobacteriota bacterium]|nr:hypothetical protein [Acidobacteriota bacterium]
MFVRIFIHLLMCIVRLARLVVKRRFSAGNELVEEPVVTNRFHLETGSPEAAVVDPAVVEDVDGAI